MKSRTCHGGALFLAETIRKNNGRHNQYFWRLIRTADSKNPDAPEVQFLDAIVSKRY